MAPGELKGEQLIAFIYRETPDAPVLRHLLRCAACRAALAQYRRVAHLLLRVYYRRSCPAADTLLAYVIGELAAAEAEAVTGHLQGCGECLAEVEILVAAAAQE
ncbi:MAG TPA: hypothetical protein VKV26_24030 [Dehalococcoidia bacterium]|nr:hypothetical protein [Dehalococcoidia bacterium]